MNFSDQVRSLRMSGSCALNLCGIACGRLDLFYELGFGGPWYVFVHAVLFEAWCDAQLTWSAPVSGMWQVVL